MKLTALEIRKQEFARAFRGYDAEEVDAFLNMVAQHWQTMSQDMRRMEDRLEEQTQRVNHYLKVEEALEHALENARTISEEKLGAAEEEAGTKLKEAEARAEETIRDAEIQAAESIRSAEEQASETIRTADQHARTTRENVEREAAEIMRAAAVARHAANEEFQAWDAARKRVLDDLLHLLQSSLEAVRKYDTDGSGPAVSAFSAALAHMGDTAVEGDGAPKEELPGISDDVENPPEAVVREDEHFADPPTDMELAPEDKDLPQDPTDGESVVDPPNEGMLADLPSADDSFEEATAQPLEGPEQVDDDFGAEDEIKKIRRILEDLDN